MSCSPDVVEKADVALAEARIPLIALEVDVVVDIMVLPDIVMSLAPFKRKPLLFGV